jgi:hypothetical protein
MINAFIIPFEGKLHSVFVIFAHILTNNPLRVDLNIRLFYYFLEVGFHLVKQSKHPYVGDKLL